MPEGLPNSLRWGAAGLFVTTLHVLPAIFLSTRPPVVEADSGAPVVLLDLAPVLTAPRQEAIGTDAQTAIQASPPKDVFEERPLAEQQQQQVPPSNVDSAIEAPREPPQKPPEPPRPSTAEEQSASTSGPPLGSEAERLASPAAGQTKAQASRQMVSWQRALLARLEKAKRYPAQANGSVGVVRVAFTIDRGGQIVSSEIVESSGSAALDAEALYMLRRAAPFPTPPLEAAEPELSFVVPVQFVRRR